MRCSWSGIWRRGIWVWGLVDLLGVDHKMGHYTDFECVAFLSVRNYRLCFNLQKNPFKVAHVMTKPHD